jgi:hypothetical protein
VYLQEDGLELWRACMRHATAMTPELLSLVPIMISLLRDGTDVLGQVLKLVEGYTLLDADVFLQVGFFDPMCQLLF